MGVGDRGRHNWPETTEPVTSGQLFWINRVTGSEMAGYRLQKPGKKNGYNTENRSWYPTLPTRFVVDATESSKGGVDKAKGEPKLGREGKKK